MFWKDASAFMPILLEGVRLTVVVTLGSLLLSTVLGLVWALMRVSAFAPWSGSPRAWSTSSAASRSWCSCSTSTS